MTLPARLDRVRRVPRAWAVAARCMWAIVAAMAVGEARGNDGPAADGPDAVAVRHFETHVRPVLVERCGRCHGDREQKGGLRVDGLVALLRGGDSGPAIVPGDPAASLLVAAIRHDGVAMPPDGKLADGPIAAIEVWIASGAPWPGMKPAADLIAAGLPPDDTPVATGPRPRSWHDGITAADRGHWAYRLLERPALPADFDGAGAHPIDRFINARLTAAGLEPVEPAEPQVLVRRLYLDLLGVPPSPAETEAFVADPSPDAYDRLVERLLTDRRHGERQARHWLDLARYAESDGYRQDAFRPTAWRYRDFVVDAFNANMPFDRFLQWQLAGDEVAPGDPAALVATGFLRQTPYEYNQVDAVGQWTTILTEVTDVAGDVFLAMGMGCARCHDHKFDPIRQADYYRLQAFFAALDWRDGVVVDPPGTPPPTAAQAAYAARVAEFRGQMAAIEDAARFPAAWAGQLPLSRFPESTQEMIVREPHLRSPWEEQIVRLASRQLKFTPGGLGAEDQRWYQWLSDELAAFEKRQAADKPPEPAVAAVAGDVGCRAPPIRIPGHDDPLEPGFPAVISGAEPVIEPVAGAAGGAGSTGRRRALAAWLTDRANPLTPRVVANRLWQWHFGRGLAANASDFGRLGGEPSHPELLDWLAVELVESGWDLARLDRLIVTSAVYRRAARAAAGDPVAVRGRAVDPDNHLWWRQDCRRLDADQVRDAALAISGELDATLGGPSVPPTAPRRSLYTTAFRNTRDALAEAFDAPDGYASCARRDATTTPTQALFLINGEWMLARARALALAIERDLAAAEQADDGARAAAALRRVTGREPSAETIAEAAAFLTGQRRLLDADASTQLAGFTRRMPQRDGVAAVFDPGGTAPVLALPTTLPTAPGDGTLGDGTLGDGALGGDFTVEAAVLLESLFADATPRTIAARWSGNAKQPGWALGVTGKASRFTPQSLVLQLAGGSGEVETLVPDIRLELQRPYAVAASVRLATDAPGEVLFVVHDLSDNDAAPIERRMPIASRGPLTGKSAFTIGGRDVGGEGGVKGAVWAGLIDDVRLSDGALGRSHLLPEPSDTVIGLWTFEERPGFLADASGRGRPLVRPGAPAPPVADMPRYEALVDLCHVLLNSSDFLYVE